MKNILVEVIGEDGLELANEIIKQCKAINAKAELNVISYKDLSDFLITASKEDIIEYGRKDYERMKKMQAYIGISTPRSDKVLDGTGAQTFKIDYNSDCNFRIKPKCSNYSKAISITNEGFNNELNVVQKNISTSANQAWILEPVVRSLEFGRFYIEANYDNHLLTFPNCENMGGDCTNFASQCLLAQGVHMRDNWYMYKKNTAFEAPSNVASFRFSWDTGDPAPWINADDFKFYWGSADHRVEKAYGYKSSYVASNMQEVFETTDFQVGDIIQLAQVGSNDSLGTAHHSMVVSSIKNNVYYIAEHTNSAFDKSIIDIANNTTNEYILFYKFYQ